MAELKKERIGSLLELGKMVGKKNPAVTPSASTLYEYGYLVRKKFKIGVWKNPVTEDACGLFSGKWKVLKFIGYDCNRMNARKDE